MPARDNDKQHRSERLNMGHWKDTFMKSSKISNVYTQDSNYTKVQLLEISWQGSHGTISSICTPWTLRHVPGDRN